MPDFDPDAWMAKQKTAAAPTKTSGFDPDAWMAKQKQPSQPKRGVAEAEADLLR